MTKLLLASCILMAAQSGLASAQEAQVRLWADLRTGMSKDDTIKFLKNSEGRSPTYNKGQSLTYTGLTFLQYPMTLKVNFNRNKLISLIFESDLRCYDESLVVKKTFDDGLATKYKAVNTTSAPSDYVLDDTAVTVSILPQSLPEFPQEPTPPQPGSALYGILVFQYKQDVATWLSAMERVRQIRDRCGSGVGLATATVTVTYQALTLRNRAKAQAAEKASADEQARKRRANSQQKRLDVEQKADKDKI